MRGLRIATAALSLLLFAGAVACNDDDDPPPATNSPAPASPQATPTATGAPGSGDRATLSGVVTLDGVPLETDFLGARVIRDGLAAACQDDIPAVRFGNYEIPVAADAEVRGCGVPGASIVLWTFVDGAYYFSQEAAPWPGDGESTAFDATFSSADPLGATAPVTEMKGRLLARDGSELPAGTVVEAYAGDVLCGVTSLRHGGVTEGLYTLVVAGPEAVPGCASGATLTFRLDGAPAVETTLNDLGTGSGGHELDLTLE